MSWSAYRDRLLAANPKLIDPTCRLTLSGESLLRQLEKAYRNGAADVMGDVLDDGRQCGDEGGVFDFLTGIFGKK